MDYAIRPRNWAKFQHYNKRNPPWVKLHRGLLDDFNFHRLPDASRALAPMLWLMASEHISGEIRTETAELAFRFRQDSAWIDAAIKPLIGARFFEEIDIASALLVPAASYATSESESEGETETEGESLRRDSSSSMTLPLGLDSANGSGRDFTQDAVDIFNEKAPACNWPKVQKLTDARRTKLRARLDDVGGIEGWQVAMDKAAASDFLTGRKKGVEWHATFDFFMQAASFTRLMEGAYDNRKANDIPQGGTSARARAYAAVDKAMARRPV